MNIRILLCGYSSFAAQGLAELLLTEGHDVHGFGRRDVLAGCQSVYVGRPADILQSIPESLHFDVVINFLLIKDGGIAENVEYLKQLIAFCHRRGVRHLIHISSISVYPGRSRIVNEQSPIESDPNAKGAYGSIKVAADQFLLNAETENLKISFVRPGFILGEGLVDPIVGMAFRTPWNRLLMIGAGANTVPMTTKAKVHELITHLVDRNDSSIRQHGVYFAVDNKSPTRKQYLDWLCKNAGYAKSVLSVPLLIWKAAGLSANTIATLLGLPMRPGKSIYGACRIQRFNSDSTQNELGIDLTVDWQNEMVCSLSHQATNVSIRPANKPESLRLQSVSYLGWGRIVKQKHLPALKKLATQATIRAYDIRTFQDGNQRVADINTTSVAESDLHVVATPGPAHISAIDHLRSLTGPILVEKPLAYSSDELTKWLEFCSDRTDPISVCHNYRFKHNVREMLEHLSEYNPGRLHHVRVTFHSPPVANDSAAWLRNERRSKTLLMDYGIHFLDIGSMFGNGDWSLDTCRHVLNERGETSLIQGNAKCDAYSMDFLLRQGAFPRQANIEFTFQNYDVRLSFFPDTFIPKMSNESSYVWKQYAKGLAAATRAKVIEKLTKIDGDESHAYAIHAAFHGDESISLEQLACFYRLLFAIEDRVYSRPDEAIADETHARKLASSV